MRYALVLPSTVDDRSISAVLAQKEAVRDGGYLVFVDDPNQVYPTLRQLSGLGVTAHCIYALCRDANEPIPGGLTARLARHGMSLTRIIEARVFPEPAGTAA